MTASIEELLADAESRLQASTGGRALCRVTADGAPGRAVKLAEGRWAAIRALSRAVGADADADRQREHARLLLDEWQAELARWSTHENSSWIPYCEGGVAALKDFLRAG
jgi:hypothetical protein